MPLRQPDPTEPPHHGGPGASTIRFALGRLRAWLLSMGLAADASSVEVDRMIDAIGRGHRADGHLDVATTSSGGGRAPAARER